MGRMLNTLDVSNGQLLTPHPRYHDGLTPEWVYSLVNSHVHNGPNYLPFVLTFLAQSTPIVIAKIGID